MDIKEWQRGFPLDRLKAFAAPFRARHKPLVFGAFGLTKERDVAEALADGRAIWTGGEAPRAVALFTVPKVTSHQTDFAQREFAVPPGHVNVKAFAALDVEAGAKVLGALVERAGAPVWVEIFEEDETAAASLEAVGGFRYATSKVMAGSEIKGIYTNGEVPLPDLGREELATLLVLDREFLSLAELDAIRAEVAAFASLWEQHYSSYNKRQSWEAFALRGYDNDPHFIIKPAEMSKQWKEENKMRLLADPRATTAAQHFPATLKAVERIAPLSECDRVRFMRLRCKNGELSRHADITERQAGPADGKIVRLHVPLVTSPAVHFFGWTARGKRIERTIPEGALFYLDMRKPHAVTNTDPNLDRVHLVVDCFSTAKLRELISEVASREGASGYGGTSTDVTDCNSRCHRL